MCVAKVTGSEYRVMLLQDTRDHQKGKSRAEGVDGVASVLRLPQSGAQMEEQGRGRGHGAGSAPIPAHLGLVRGPGETCQPTLRGPLPWPFSHHFCPGDPYASSESEVL